MFSSKVGRAWSILVFCAWASRWPAGRAAAQRSVSVLPAPSPARAEAVPREEGGTADTAPRPANYRIEAGDTVAVKVFREPTLDTNQRVSKDGTINYPLLGVIHVGGKTTNEAAVQIAALLDKDYIVRPQVAVSIATYTKQKFTVLGQVTTPGSYEIPEEQTVDLLTAIARAGGFTRLAQPAKVTVRRVTDGQEEVFTVDAKRLMNDKASKRFLIQPNDTISVAERFF